MVKIGQPLGFCELGKRRKQEDFLYPSLQELNPTNQVFSVCDGMGGHMNGEIASRLVATGLSKYAQTYLEKDATCDGVRRLLDVVWCELDEYYDEIYRDHQMGTTMTFAYFHDKGCLVAHIGDSRIYHIRPGKLTTLCYRSVDHSQVGTMIEKGEITQLDSLTVPYRNYLNRSMMPKERYDADIRDLTDLKVGDYIFLCTDGVVENMTDDMLRFIFAPYRTPNEILDLIRIHTELSSDNHTCLLIPIIEENSVFLNETSQYSTKKSSDLILEKSDIFESDKTDIGDDKLLIESLKTQSVLYEVRDENKEQEISPLDQNKKLETTQPQEMCIIGVEKHSFFQRIWRKICYWK